MQDGADILFRMPLKETIEMYSYFIFEADKLEIAYIDLVRYADMLDPVIDSMQSFRFYDAARS